MADSEETLDDLSDKSSDTENVSSSEYSASSDSVSEEENLAGETTSSDSSKKRKPAKVKCSREFGELTAAKENGTEI